MIQYCINCGSKNKMDKVNPHKKCKNCGKSISLVGYPFYYSAPISQPNPPGEDEPANQEEPNEP